ncbi:hypothetical protein G8S55_09425 [Clostridium botulinum C]|nr:hypothetical protein [Clostridium botulinum]MCD3217464.1 hypothetical protein [Clostridium botulinum C]
MSQAARAILLIETTRILAPFLNEQETNDIREILLAAIERMTKELYENN